MPSEPEKISPFWSHTWARSMRTVFKERLRAAPGSAATDASQLRIEAKSFYGKFAKFHSELE